MSIKDITLYVIIYIFKTKNNYSLKKAYSQSMGQYHRQARSRYAMSLALLNSFIALRLELIKKRGS